MLFLLALIPLVAAAPQYPANVDPSSCANYPYCGPSPIIYIGVPGAEKVINAQKQIKHLNYIASLPLVPVVPGADIHAEQEAAQLAAMGVPAGKLIHDFAVSRVLQQQKDYLDAQKNL